MTRLMCSGHATEEGIQAVPPVATVQRRMHAADLAIRHQ